ncbi:MAG: hypothetical protein L0Z50_39040 [Verrucomicrobiales bacterium]|nr:hypothetical protein [Verrucomicrobiales bacterium]
MLVTKFIRRTHMYLALFLTPWMLIYGLSTMAMNHRGFFKRLYGAGAPAFEREKEVSYAATFPPGAEPRAVSRQILRDLGMDGAHAVEGSLDEGEVRIRRFAATGTRRLIYKSVDRSLVIERQVFRAPAFLEHMHRRRGFDGRYLKDDAWGASVDIVIVAMVFWALSGLWMWWELKSTRWIGAACALSGLVVFGFFLFRI